MIIVKIANETRWILHYEQDPNKPHFGNHMIKLERHIKARLEGQQIDLQLESSVDKNKRDIKSGRAVKEEALVNARKVEKLED